MKRLAGSVLLAAAAVFVVSSVVSDSSVIGFVRAGAEAAMVGGLADWFAITALFRRPLRLPIPHTALIPTRKDQLADSLGQFVTTTFLTRENVGERLTESDIVSKIALWLADRDNAQRVGGGPRPAAATWAAEPEAANWPTGRPPAPPRAARPPHTPHCR